MQRRPPVRGQPVTVYSLIRSKEELTQIEADVFQLFCKWLKANDDWREKRKARDDGRDEELWGVHMY